MQLIAAASSGNVAEVRLLSDSGADVDARTPDEYETTALIISAYKGHAEIVRVLLEHGAEVNRADIADVTPLMVAAAQGHQDIVDLLLEHKANLNIQEKMQGKTALMFASERGNHGVIESLLSNGAKLELESKEGLTAWALASAHSHNAAAKLLENAGARQKVYFPSTLSALVDEVMSLCARTAFQRLTPEETRARIVEKAELIEIALDRAFETRGQGIHPAAAFLLLDAASSLITRNMILRRRAQPLIGSLSSSRAVYIPQLEHLELYLHRETGTAICSFYLTKSGGLWAIVAQNPRNMGLAYLHIEIVTEAEGPEFKENLERYVSSCARKRPDTVLVARILARVGSAVLSSLGRLWPSRKLVLIPHGLLHAVPLHAMFYEDESRRVYLDECVPAISYASCLAELLFATRSDQGTRALAVLDKSAADLEWVAREQEQFELWRSVGLPVDLVLSHEHLPTDLRQYGAIHWSSHATSSPASWGASFLSFGSIRITAKQIVESWNLAGAPIVTLAGCETAVDLGDIKQVDECCGLDMAFRVAGARAVLATMWPIADATAAVAALLLFSGQLEFKMPPSCAAVSLQRNLRDGTWKDGIYLDREKPALSAELLKSAESLLDHWRAIPRDAFRSLSDWAIFRCSGD